MTIWHAPTDPTRNEYGDEVHPAFGMIRASRGQSTPGVVLFDSDLRHTNVITLCISHASRKRDLNHDWLHSGQDLIEVQMSEAQWAGFVSSMNTQGVPCTIRRTENDYNVDGLEFAPRLAESMREVRGAAEEAFAEIKRARDAYEALPSTPTKANKEALRNLHYAIENAAANVEFAGKKLNEHTENVVQKARADIEAMVVAKATQLGIEAPPTGVLEIEA